MARAIYHSHIPVVTGIGHEIDFTIADFCADFRAPTPTGAAEKIIPDNIRLLATIHQLQGQLSSAMRRKIEDGSSRVAYNRRLLGDLGSLFVNASLRLDGCVSGLVQSIKDILHRQATSCEQLTRRLHNQAPLTKIRFRQQHLEFLINTMEQRIVALLERKTTAFQQQVTRLNTMSPLATLARGYSIVSRGNGVHREPGIVTNSIQVELKDSLEIRLHQGRIFCKVTGKE